MISIQSIILVVTLIHSNLVSTSSTFDNHKRSNDADNVYDETKRSSKNQKSISLKISQRAKSMKKTFKRDSKDFQQLLDIISQVSSEQSLKRQSSPQALALDWLLYSDNFLQCQDVMWSKSIKAKRMLKGYSTKSVKGGKHDPVTSALKPRREDKSHESKKELKKSVPKSPKKVPFVDEMDRSNKNPSPSITKSSLKSMKKIGSSAKTMNNAEANSGVIACNKNPSPSITHGTKSAPKNSSLSKTSFLVAHKQRIIQRYVLAVFYFSTQGDDSWIACGRNSKVPCDLIVGMRRRCSTINKENETHLASSWLSAAHECEWGGLECEEPDIIHRIDFASNGISGILPSELAALSGLKFLNIEGAMNVNEYWESEHAYLSGTIPSALGKLNQLVSLNLNFNKLNGTLPLEMFHLTNLIQLDLNENVLSGTIPKKIGSLVRLRYLQLESNRFEGSVPMEVSFLKNLEIVTLWNTSLSGQVPPQLCSLRNSKSLGKLHVLEAGCSDTVTHSMNAIKDATLGCSCCTRCVA